MTATADAQVIANGSARIDSRAAEDLFQGIYQKLAGWVRHLVDDDDTARDIASEAFARLLSRWSQVESRPTYLYASAANIARDHWRKAERERRAYRTVTAGAGPGPLTSPAHDDIRALVSSLPPRLRHPVLLYYYAGFRTREVATLLGKPEGTVKADLSAARARLKAALDERSA